MPTFEFDRKGACSVEITPYLMEPETLHITALTGEQRKWYLDYIRKISREMQENGDRWYDIWCARQYDMPLDLFSCMASEDFKQDPEDENALKHLPPARAGQISPATAIRNFFPEPLRHESTLSFHVSILFILSVVFQKKYTLFLKLQLSFCQRCKTGGAEFFQCRDLFLQ